MREIALCCDARLFGGLSSTRGFRDVALEACGGRWELRPYARGWNLVAVDGHGRIDASYSQPWLLPGRLTAGGQDTSVHLPIALRPWRVKADRGTLLELDRFETGLRDRIVAPPGGDHPCLLVAFALAVVWLRAYFRTPPMNLFLSGERNAETLDDVGDVFDGGDGGGAP